jgi:hypothetical protein
MNSRQGLQRIISRIAAAAQKLAARFSQQKPEAPRKWPNLAPQEPVPPDPAEHAADFAGRWVEQLENFVEGRMHALDVPEHQIGASDHKNRVAWRTFFPDEGTGGSNGPGDRVNVDGGVLNLDLLTKDYAAKAAEMWARERLKDRIDAIIIHELAEAEAGTHEAALKLAPETERPISARTRTILRAMRDGWKRR